MRYNALAAAVLVMAAAGCFPGSRVRAPEPARAADMENVSAEAAGVSAETSSAAMMAMIADAVRLDQAGQTAAALEQLLRLPADAPPEIRADALARVRDQARRVSVDELGHSLMITPLGQPLAAPVMIEYARSMMLAGRSEESARYARAAVEAGAEGADAETAEMLIAEAASASGATGATATLPPGLSIALALPLGGATGPATNAIDLALQGARMALSGAAPDVSGAPNVGGVPASAAGAPATSPASGAVPSSTPVPLLLRAASDPEAARTLADYLTRSGITQVVLLRGADAPAQDEASLFTQAFESLGGSVLRAFTYPAGGRTIREAVDATRNLRPHAVVLAVSAADVPTLWPLVRAAGFPALGARIIGTSAWSAVLNSGLRPTQAIDGMISVRPAPAEASPTSARFNQLNDPARSSLGYVEDDALALGFDAASLLRLAVRSGARDQAEVERALAQIRNFRGASGTVSVENGGITRRQVIVCIEANSAHPCPPT